MTYAEKLTKANAAYWVTRRRALNHPRVGQNKAIGANRDRVQAKASHDLHIAKLLARAA